MAEETQFFSSSQQAITGFDVGLVGLQMIGAFAQAKASRKNAKYAAALARMRAHNARSRGGSAAAQRLGKGYRQASAIRTQTAARGFDVKSGTAARLEEDATLLARIDANTIRDNAEREAYGYDSMATQYNANAPDPFLAATGTLVSNAGAVAHRWRMRQAAGIS